MKASGGLLDLTRTRNGKSCLCALRRSRDRFTRNPMPAMISRSSNAIPTGRPCPGQRASISNRRALLGSVSGELALRKCKPSDIRASRDPVNGSRRCGKLVNHRDVTLPLTTNNREGISMCRTARQIFACGMAALVFLSAGPAPAMETCNPVSTPMTTLACKEDVKGSACDSPLVKAGGSRAR